MDSEKFSAQSYRIPGSGRPVSTQMADGLVEIGWPCMVSLRRALACAADALSYSLSGLIVSGTIDGFPGHNFEEGYHGPDLVRQVRYHESHVRAASVRTRGSSCERLTWSIGPYATGGPQAVMQAAIETYDPEGLVELILMTGVDGAADYAHEALTHLGLAEVFA